MSILYYIDAKLQATYIAENILHIFKEGEKNHFIYYGDPFECSRIIDLQVAVDKILLTDPDSGERHINITLKETNFIIWFFKSDDNFLRVSIGDFTSPRRIDCKHCGMRMIDFAHYMRLLLKLCKDFVILELEASSDAYESLE